ncbi:uncharacterized protein [Halyomorpha halys]|uniref:uncharacterized protein n=1 Tax=Halyomorpha halys TaxID=286706 RepID=UPI0034D1A80D
MSPHPMFRYKWVTMIDLFSKAAMAHRVQDRSSQVGLPALRLWFKFYGVPERISSDGGREFDNSLIRKEMKDLDVIWNLNTQSRGGVERLHGTLSDHLRLYQADQGLEPDVAMPKAIAAYNHSVHSVTGFRRFRCFCGLCGIR